MKITKIKAITRIICALLLIAAMLCSDVKPAVFAAEARQDAEDIAKEEIAGETSAESEIAEEAADVGAAAQSAVLEPAYSENKNRQDYSGYGADSAKSYLYENPAGGLTRVEYIELMFFYGPDERIIVVEDYDSRFSLRSSITIPMELPIWGGFYAGEEFNYVIFGQANFAEDNNKEVVRIVKYSKDWRRLGHASLRGANTVEPFAFGSLRCAEDGDYLYIRTCHRMYKAADGLNHQANMTIAVRQSDMAITDSFYLVSNDLGYVSHSFNQFILIDREDRLVTLDHGDDYPRSLVLQRYDWKAESQKFNGPEIGSRRPLGTESHIQEFPVPNEYTYNYTGACVGGFAETKSGYVTAYNYAWEDDMNRIVYLGYTTKDGLLSTKAPVSEPGTRTPVLVPEGTDGGYVLWTDYNDNFYYARYSENGTAGKAAKAAAALSDCQPIFYQGEFVWYVTSVTTWTGGDEWTIDPTFTFYRLNPATGKITASELEIKKLSSAGSGNKAALAREMALPAAPSEKQEVFVEALGAETPAEESAAGAERFPGETDKSEETAPNGESDASEEMPSGRETAASEETLPDEESAASEETPPGRETAASEETLPKETETSPKETASEETSTDETLEAASQNRSIVFAGTDIANGEYRKNGSNITWVIDKDGKLTVEGSGDFALGDIPWQNYGESIVSATIRVTGMTRASSMFGGCWGLKSVDLSGLDTSQMTSMDAMFYDCANLESVDLSGFDTSRVTYMCYMFYNCLSLKSLDVSSFDTSQVTDMRCMFYNCSSLKSLDVSSFDTSRVNDMKRMFSGCSNLKSLDLRTFDTSQAGDMTGMFHDCISLTSVDVSSFNTSHTRTMTGMFADCSSLTSIDVSGFKTSQADDMSGMFSGCKKLTSLNVGNFDTSRVRYMWRMFSGCTSLTSLDVSNFDTSQVTFMDDMFKGCTSLTSLDVSNFDTSQATSMNGMFYGCKKLTSLDVSNFDTSQAITMNGMFYGCKSLTSLDISNFDTSQAANISEMFSHCSSLQSLNLSNFKTNNVTNMSYLFSDCASLTSLDLSSFDTGNVTTVQGMFANCASLASLNVSNFDTSQVTDMQSMFRGCANLDELDVSSFNTSQALFMDLMFYDCSSLTDLNVSSFDTGKALTMNGMFYGCSSLKSLDLSKFDTSNTADMGWMFYDCASLTSLNLSNLNTGNTLYIYDMFAGCTSLKSLDLSSFDASLAVNMDQLFDACINLNEIKTPRSITKSVPLPAGAWQKEDGSSLKELPQNQDASILIKKAANSPDIPASAVIASGEYRENGSDIFWEISLDGKLTVTGTGDFAAPGGNIRNAPWHKYRKSIVSAEICVTGMTDASRMFYGCSSLTSLDLSGFDMSNLSSGGCNGMFPNPHKLQSIYTPYNLQTSVLLPAGSWHKSDGAVLAELPQNLDYSIMIQNGGAQAMPAAKPEIKAVKKKTVYSSGEALNLDDITVKYYAADHTAKKLDSSAYTTNADQIDMKKAEKQTLSITYQTGDATLRADIVLTILPFVPVESISIGKDSLTLETGQSISLMPSIIPDNATESTVIWASSNPAVAIAADGIVTAIAAGQCDIAAMIGEKIATCKVTVTGSSESTLESNLQISLEDGAEYVYTGRPIKPSVIVTNNGIPLIEGKDYSLSYKNNTKAADKTARNAPTVTVNGKGSLSGSRKLPFTIRQREINDEEVTCGNVIAIKGKTAVPLLFFDGVKLGKNDIDTSSNTSLKFEQDGIITVTGKGNFTGTRQVNVKVIRKEDSKSFTVAIDSKKLKSSPLVYDGSPKTIDSYLSVYDSKDKAKAAPLKNGIDYAVIYPRNHTDAGTVKVTVAGLGIYGSSITKTYPILPKAVKDGSISVNVKDGAVYPFNAGGAAIPDIQVLCGSVLLAQGKDYLVAYRNNKNACSDNKAECKISFTGNYKGSTAIIRRFNISKAVLSDEGLKDGSIRIAAANMIYTKPGVYKSAPYVTVNDALLKPSDYNVTYYMDDACTQEMNGKGASGRLDLSAADSVKIYLKITGKGNYDGTLNADYTVSRLKEGNIDLSKIRVGFPSGKKAAYTGEAVTPDISIWHQSGGTGWWMAVPAADIGTEITVTCINNVSRGTAIVLINGAGGKYAGGRKETFAIVS